MSDWLADLDKLACGYQCSPGRFCVLSLGHEEYHWDTTIHVVSAAWKAHAKGEAKLKRLKKKASNMDG